MCKRFELHQRIGISRIDHDLRHASLKPCDLSLRIGRHKRADGGVSHLGGELAFGERE